DVEAGAADVTVHIEAVGDAHATLARIRSRGARAGLTLNPETRVDAVMPYLGEVDLMLVMSVHPGFGGQKFIEASLDKVRTLRASLDRASSRAELEVDGGLKLENARLVASAGATVVVAGSAVFEDPDGPLNAVGKFKQALRGD